MVKAIILTNLRHAQKRHHELWKASCVYPDEVQMEFAMIFQFYKATQSPRLIIVA